MAYETPVTDRALSDITNRTSKGFFNIADWIRIFNNARLAIDVANINGGESFSWDHIAEPTITSIPSVTDFNTLLENIELARQGLASPLAPTAIKYDWEAGVNKDTFKYTHVNTWERIIDVLWVAYNGAAVTVCPTLSADLTITTGNQGVYIDCIDCANFNIDLQDTANLYII